MNRQKGIYYLVFLAALALVSLIYNFLFIKQNSPTSITGQSENLEILIQPEAGRRPILDAIDSAQSEILVEVYLFSDRQVINALKEARDRGVKVQIMLEKNPFGGGNINRSTQAYLDSVGIENRWTNPTFALTHAKFIIVDRQKVLIMNQNLTQSAFGKNREYNIIDTNFEDVAEIYQIFSADWERNRYGPAVPDLVVSPDNSRGKLEGLILSATTSLDLEVEILEDPDMIKLLSDRAKNIKIKVLVPDFSQVPTNKRAAQQLTEAGVDVKTLKSPYLHAKMLVADRARAYVGSVNFSSASMEQNRELGILLSQTDIIDKLNGKFEIDWMNGWQ